MYGEFTNTWAGPITLLETNWVQVTWGSKLTVDGPVFGPAILNSIGNGELVLAGSQPNTISGLIMDEGILRLAKPAGVPAFLGDFSLNTEGFDNVPPTLILEASGQFPPQATARLGHGGGTNAVFNLNGHAATIRRLLGFGTVDMGAGALTISNSTAQYSDFLGRLQSAPGGQLRHQGIGTQRGGTFALNGAAWLQGGTMYFDTGYIDEGLDISTGAVMDMYSPLALFGSLSGAGRLITSSGIIFVGANNASTTFSGLIEGFGNTNLVKIGTGALTLAGTSTHAGKMVVWNGALLANGAMPGPAHVEASFGGITATLGGTGTLGNVVVIGQGARVAPGATTSVPSYGKLTVNNIAIVDGALYRCEIGGTNAGVNLDQIESKETTTLSGVTLTSGAADFTAFGAGVVSNRYMVVKSLAAVNGTFQGKSEGSTIIPGAGRSLQITYLGGAGGGDIVLMDLSAIPPGSFSGIQRLPNGTIQIGGTGTPGVTYEVQANDDLNSTNWLLLGTSTASVNGAFTFSDPGARHLPMRFYRFVLP
jgi:autotransporter-associated beta strand protein